MHVTQRDRVGNVGAIPSVEKICCTMVRAVSGTIPSIWAEKSTQARMMTIVGVMISGNRLMTAIHTCTNNLKYCILSFLLISGTIPGTINGTIPSTSTVPLLPTTLTAFFADKTRIVSGTMPKVAADHQALRGLYLGCSMVEKQYGIPGAIVSGILPPSLFKLTRLGRVSFENCTMSGTLPETNELQTINTSFTTVALMYNQVSGTIPSNLGHLSALLDSTSLCRAIHFLVCSAFCPVFSELKLILRHIAGGADVSH